MASLTELGVKPRSAMRRAASPILIPRWGGILLSVNPSDIGLSLFHFSFHDICLAATDGSATQRRGTTRIWPRHANLKVAGAIQRACVQTGCAWVCLLPFLFCVSGLQRFAIER